VKEILALSPSRFLDCDDEPVRFRAVNLLGVLKQFDKKKKNRKKKKTNGWAGPADAGNV